MGFAGVNNVLSMLQAMAIGAKDLEIANGVVFPVSVPVVNAKDAGVIGESTPVAGFNHASGDHVLTGASKARIPYEFAGFVYAGTRAVDTLSVFPDQKGFPALLALDCDEVLHAFI